MDKVLVIIGYTDFKWYCRPLYPRIYNDLLYKKKEVLFVDEEMYPDLAKNRTGDEICAEIRRIGINQAIDHNFDWVFFLDLDAIPDANIIETLLEANYPFIGGAIACRGDSSKIIGHIYGSWEAKDRYAIKPPDFKSIMKVDGISGALMMVHKSIFEHVGYDGYKGVNMYPGRTTCDDEFYCIKVHDHLKITPLLHLGARAWHLHHDSYGYKWPMQKKQFTRNGDIITFNREKYGQE